ncbi:unnamed protein product, partial [Medioppia subpectinata]
MAEVCSRQFSLRHLKHETKVNQSLYAMLVDESLVDVIVSTDGTNIRAHRLILSANSSYFKTLFDSLEANRCQIPIVILKDVPLVDLKAIIEFMYRGEVCVEERHLSSVLKSAELLKVNGLTEVCLALRSRLNSERLANTSAAGNDGNSSSASDQTILRKRPRISDDLKQTPQTTDLFSRLSNARDDLKQTPQTTDLFSRLSNARFEIRPSALSPNNSRPKASSSGQSVVKNIVIPSNQIHNKKASPEVQSMVNRMSSPSSSSTSAVSATHNSRQNSPNHSFRSPIKKTNTPNNGTPDRVLTSTWTPSQSSLSQSVNNELSSNCSLNVNSFVEVLLDDETPEQTDDEIDIKPPIFELNQRLAEQMAADSRRSDDPSPRKDREPDLKSTDKPKPSPPKTTATARTVAKAGRPPPPPPQSSVKSRSSS